MVVNSGIDYELRSTIHPDLHTDFMIRKMIDEVYELNVKSYYLQHFIQVEQTVGDLKPTKSKLNLLKYLPKLEHLFEHYGIRNG